MDGTAKPLIGSTPSSAVPGQPDDYTETTDQDG